MRPVAAWRLDRSQGGVSFLRTVELDQGGNVQIGDAVAVRQTECLVADVLLNAFDAPSGHGSVASIYQRDPPWLSRVLVDLGAVILDIESDISAVQKIIRKIFLDDAALVPAANNEIG